MASWNWRMASSRLAFLVEGDAEVVVRAVIVLRDFKRMPE